MSADLFADRVRALRGSWEERREAKSLAGAHDFESQFELLEMLHGWTVRAAADVAEVYGGDLELRLSPPPSRSPGNAAFAVVVAGAFVLSFRLAERQRMGAAGWFVSVSVAATTGGNAVMAGPERRYGQWTRGRIEELLLTVLGGYERSRSEGEAPKGLDGRVRARA
jgi:hypothetical protein